jgi:hypothetical protein
VGQPEVGIRIGHGDDPNMCPGQIMAAPGLRRAAERVDSFHRAPGLMRSARMDALLQDRGPSRMPHVPYAPRSGLAVSIGAPRRL